MAKTTIKTATFLFMVFTAAVFAEDHDVGGGIGWRIPSKPNFYSEWASGKTFRVGDVLKFKFTNGAHTVANVTKEVYDSCGNAKPANIIANGPAKVPLNTTGSHYFICTFAGHCQGGQKLSIDVVGAKGASGGAGGGAGGTGSPRPSAASSFRGAAILVALMSSTTVALLC